MPSRKKSRSRKRSRRKSKSILDKRFHWLLVDLIREKRVPKIKNGEEMYRLTTKYLQIKNPKPYSKISASQKKKYTDQAKKINRFASL